MPRYFFHVKRSQVTVLDQEVSNSQTLFRLKKRHYGARNSVWRMSLGRNACQPWNVIVAGQKSAAAI
jgi:hypothetical protein